MILYWFKNRTEGCFDFGRILFLKIYLARRSTWSTKYDDDIFVFGRRTHGNEENLTVVLKRLTEFKKFDYFSYIKKKHVKISNFII